MLQFNLDPSSIEINSPEKQFEYVKYDRLIEQCRNVEDLQNLARYLLKLDMKRMEVCGQLLFDSLPKDKENPEEGDGGCIVRR